MIIKDPFGAYHKDHKITVVRKNNFVNDEFYNSSENSNKNFNSSHITQQINYFLLIILCLSALIIFKLYFLQIINGKYYSGMSEGNRIRIREITAPRGLIYDRNSELLADNTYNFILEFVPIDLPKEDDKKGVLIDKVSNIINQDKNVLASLYDTLDFRSYLPIIVQDNLTREQAVLVRILNSEYPGVVLEIGSRRKYYETSHQSLSHILGYMGKINPDELKENNSQYSQTDYIGKNGLELFYENYLKGKKGKEEFEVDALGRRKEIIAYTKPELGNNINITIDISMQNKLEELLYDNLQKLHKSKGVAIVENPQNGEIYAMVSLPSFSANDFSQGITNEEFQNLLYNPNNPLYNRSIQGLYPSGSTIKPILAAAALKEKVITPSTLIYSSGGIRVKQWFFPDWKASGHGYVNLQTALAESVNTYFYTIGGGYEKINGLGIEKMSYYYGLSGIGQALGIDLPGEAQGLLPNETWKREEKGEDWYIVDTYHLSIGQGDLLVTPLQVAAWTSIIANGGNLYKPHLLQNAFDIYGQSINKINSFIINEHIFSSDILLSVKRGLREAVVTGSAKRLYDLPMKVAGKTGTAQWSKFKENHAWFTGFAPYENPEIVVTILIEEGGEGSQSAVPIAKDFFQWWYDEKFTGKRDNQ